MGLNGHPTTIMSQRLYKLTLIMLEAKYEPYRAIPSEEVGF